MKFNTIYKKMCDNLKLSYEEISFVVDGYIDGYVNDNEMTKFINHIYKYGISKKELFDLTDIMINSGTKLDLSEFEYCVDKHSSGGVGDKISLIVTPIVASLGVVVPKMSGRGLGKTGGTADKLESIPGYKLNLSKREFMDMLRKHGCAIITQSENMCVADKKIYALRNEIGAVDSIPLIASSIMSKKIASGAKNIVIDLKVGNGAFMKNVRTATKLSKTMIEIGKHYNRKVVCILSDMNNPLGKNIGNKLEVQEAVDFFNRDYEYDKRLYNLVITISAYMLSISKNIPIRRAKRQAEGAINSGLAKAKLYEWLFSQGADLCNLNLQANTIEVLSTCDGYINEIDSSIIADLVFNLGSGRKTKKDKIDYNVGITIDKPLYSKVHVGDKLATIYYNKEVENMENIVRSAYKINKNKKKVNNIIIKVIK